MRNKLFSVSAVTPSGQKNAGSSASYGPQVFGSPSVTFIGAVNVKSPLFSNAAGCIKDP